MPTLPDDLVNESVRIDLVFRADRPTFGDLYTICGREHPSFPPQTERFAALADLGFDQIDDYFGIRPRTDDGDDVAVWLYPVIDGEIVEHSPGPFYRLRLSFDVLRNSPARAARFLDVAERLSTALPVDLDYRGTAPAAKAEDAIERLAADIRALQRHWQSKGLHCGSAEAQQHEP